MEHFDPGPIAYVIGFAVWLFVTWLIIRQAVAAALRQEVVRQHERILEQLTAQTKLLRVIADADSPRTSASVESADDLPPPPAARAKS